MCKAVDRGMVIGEVRLLEKRGEVRLPRVAGNPEQQAGDTARAMTAITSARRVTSTAVAATRDSTLAASNLPENGAPWLTAAEHVQREIPRGSRSRPRPPR
jgi:hypothetical protein